MKALIISLNFHPGHVSHMVASYKQCEELGYESIFYVSHGFVNYLPKGSRVVVYGEETRPKSELAIFLFPSQKNLPLIWKMKHNGCKVVYIFHEPLAPMKEYRKSGFGYKYLAKLWVINRISSLTVKWSNIILLPSKKAVGFYEANPLYVNKNFQYLPLMYDDEREERHELMPRMYFSYIGTVAADHSFKEYLDFVVWAINENKLPKLKFLIATKSEFEIPEVLQKSDRVSIHKGKPMSDEEINVYYASTYVVWNAYARTTQSGVLAKSFMFGTPALVLKKNVNEFVEDGKEVKAIVDNSNREEIEDALKNITKDFRQYSDTCRKRFLDSFYYKRYNAKFEKLVR